MSPGRPESLLDEELALSVESITKSYSEIHERRYRPAVTVFAQLRERRSGAHGGARPGPVDREAAEFEDEDEELDELDEPLVGVDTDAALADVSFDVRRGEAVGVIGAADAAARTVARILCGMTWPSSGRVVLRGRVAPSSELAIILSRRETTTRAVARRLAGLAVPGRRQRRRFVRSTLELAFGDSPEEADVARPSRQVLKRVAAAAALDPTADILVVDSLADLGDPDFPRRYRERLAERLAAGAAAVITAPDLTLISDFCSRVVWLEEGRVARIGPARELISEMTAPPASEPEPETQPPPRVRQKPPLRSFDEHAALQSVAVLGANDSPLEEAQVSDWIVLRTEFELAGTENMLVTVRFFGEETITFVEQARLNEGAFVATLRIPPGSIPAGDYVIAVGLVLERESERIKVGRRTAARIRVEGDEEDLVLAAEAGAELSAGESLPAEAEWSLEAVAV